MKLTQKSYTDDRVKKTMIQKCQKEMRKHATAVLPVIRYAPVCPKYARAYTEADVTWYQPLCVSNYKRTT